MEWLRGLLPADDASITPLVLGRRHRPDYWLLALTVILLTTGLIVIFSLSPALSETQHVSSNYYIVKQLVAIGLGMVAFVAAVHIPLGAWQRWARPLLALAAIATLLAVVMPVNPDYPAHRWVRLGGFSFQSVELLKFALLVWLAGLLAKYTGRGAMASVSVVLKPILIALGIIAVVVVGVQSDLGSMGVIVAIMAAMLLVAGVPLKRFVMILGIVVIALILAVAVIPYRRERLLAYLHPTSNCQESASGYQACQAMIAVGSGGMIGLGLGSSVQAYGYLPEAANDSIFAIYAEKFGFIGAIILFGIFVGLFTRIKNIAVRSTDQFSRLLAVGIFTWLAVQSVINIGAMIGLLPLKGITLPFISYGGTSVVFVLAAMGLVFQISRYTAYGSGIGQRNTERRAYDNSPDRRRYRGSYHPGLGNR